MEDPQLELMIMTWVLPSRVRRQARAAAVAAALPRPTTSSGDGPGLQERLFPAPSQVQT